MKLYTHLFVDLDAVCSVRAARQFIPGANHAALEFRPADWDGGGSAIGDIFLDIEAGGRGIKGEKAEGGVIHSCFALIVARHATPDDQSALAHLVRFVDAQDAHGDAFRFLLPAVEQQALAALAATGFNAVLSAIRNTHARNDALVVERMSEILSGMLQAGRARERAVSGADQAAILEGGTVAVVVKDSDDPAINGILFDERGIRVIVYVDGDNLGITRCSGESLRMDHPRIRALVEAAGEADEWYAHPAAFLYCRGSRKAPARTRSKVDPRLLAEAAAGLLR